MKRDPLIELPAALREVHARDARYVLGLDGGATKTLAGVLDLDSGELSLAHAGPSNEDSVGTHAAVQSLLAAADEALAAAGAGPQELGAAVLAVAGTDTAALARQVRGVRDESWIVVNDVVGAWATATDATPGVAAIAGTGSNVFGVGRDGRSWRAGGWGHVLGDEGSGYWLGVQSIKAALADREASGPPTALSDAALEFFGAASVEQLANLVYSRPLSKSDIAAFAIETAAVAEAGDEIARDLYARGAQEIAKLILTVIERVGLDGAFPVGLIGSAYRAGSIFVEPIERAVRERAPRAQVRTVEMAPVGGTLRLAARVCGREDADAIAQLPVTLSGALAS